VILLDAETGRERGRRKEGRGGYVAVVLRKGGGDDLGLSQ